MTVQTPPFVQQGGSHPASTFRQAIAALLGVPAGVLFAGGVSAMTAGGGHGVVGSGDLTVSQNTGADMNVKVATGFCAITGTENASQGTYLGYNDAAVTLAVSASDPTNPRRDLVVMKVRDAFYSGGSTDISLAVVTGTPAASPVDPTPPNNALVLARILVPAASTAVTNANITDLRTRAAGAGATIVCKSTARPTGASLFAGLSIFETDTLRELVYDGTAWRRVGNLTSVGRTGCNVSRAAAQSIASATYTTVTFDTKAFDSDTFITVSSDTVTVPAGLDGVYAGFGRVTWASSPGVNSMIGLLINGAIPWQLPVGAGTPMTDVAVPIGGLVLAAGDTVKMRVYQGSGAAINITGSLQLWRVGG